MLSGQWTCACSKPPRRWTSPTNNFFWFITVQFHSEHPRFFSWNAMGYGMHRDKFGNSRGSNPIGLMEMVSYLPTRMGLVSYFDTGLIFTTFYYYLIILLVTWSHILWIHRLHRLESWDTYHPYKLTQCQLYNPPMGSTLSPRLGPSKEEQLREEVPDGFGVLGLGEPWFQEQFTVERKKIRVDLENSVFGVYIYIWGFTKNPSFQSHLRGR